MLAVLNKVVGIVPPLVWASLTFTFLGMFLFNSWRLDDAYKALGAAKVAVDRAEEVNSKNALAMSGLKEANAACIAGRKADEAQFAAADTSWQVERERLNAAAQEVRTREIEIFRDPTCADLAQMDVGASCPELAQRLRVRTDSLDRIRNGGSGSSGEDPGPG